MTLTKILFFKNQKSLDNQISEDFEDVVFRISQRDNLNPKNVKIFKQTNILL